MKSLAKKISQTWEGLITIRAHGWQTDIRSDIHTSIDRTQEPFYLGYITKTWLKLVMAGVAGSLYVIVVGISVATREKVSGANIGVAFLNLISLGENRTSLITSWTSLEVSMGAVARIRAFVEGTPRESEIENPVDVAGDWPARGHLTFDKVWTANSPGLTGDAWA